MKKNFRIVLFLMSVLTYSFVYIADAQVRDKCPSVVNSPKDSLLIADETIVRYSGNEAIIECDNDTIFKKIHETHSQLFKRFTCTWKHDKKPSYKHYVIHLDRGDAQILVNWAKKHL